MLSKAFSRKQNTQTFSSKQLKNHDKKNNLTVFEPEGSLRGSYGRDVMIPLSQSATFKIKCLKWDLKDSHICME